jgi:hypothetical protein
MQRNGGVLLIRQATIRFLCWANECFAALVSHRHLGSGVNVARRPVTSRVSRQGADHELSVRGIHLATGDISSNFQGLDFLVNVR